MDLAERRGVNWRHQALGALVGLAGDRLISTVNNMSSRQIENLIREMGQNIYHYGSAAINRIRDSIMGSDHVEYLNEGEIRELNSGSRFSNIRGSNRDQASSSRVQAREQRVNQQRPQDRDQNMEQDNQDFEDAQEYLDEDGNPVGQARGSYSNGGADFNGGGSINRARREEERFMITPVNREIGPGIFPKDYRAHHTFTIETGRLNSGNIEVFEGQFLNMLMGDFTDAATSTPIDLSQFLPENPNPDIFLGAEWYFTTAYPRETALNYFSILRNAPQAKVYTLNDLNTNIPPSFSWQGHGNKHGFKEGTMGAFPISMLWKYNKEKLLVSSLIDNHDFIKLDKVEYIITDVHAWNVNQIGQNITHALTPDVGTILEVPIYPNRMVRSLINIKGITPDNLTNKVGFVWPQWRRSCTYPILEQLIHHEKTFKEWQTGWTGGEFKRTLHARKDNWWPTTYMLEDIRLSNRLSSYLGIDVDGSIYTKNDSTKSGLFSDSINLDFRHDAGEHFTVLDFDLRKKDHGNVFAYSPYSNNAFGIRHSPWHMNAEPKLDEMFGGMGMGDALNKQIMFYMRRKTPQENTRAFMKYSLQVRATYSVRTKHYMSDTASTQNALFNADGPGF